jgi:Spy/CpxP family protein refolding chaperone
MRTIGTTLRNTVGALALLTMIPVAGWAAGEPGGGPGFQGPPKEAYDACAGKQAGDPVQFTTPRGDNVAAVCREFDGKLAAQPAGGPAGGGMEPMGPAWGGRGSMWDGPDQDWYGPGPGWGGRGYGRHGRWAGRGYARGGGGMGMGMGFGQDSCFLSEALNLTAEQKTKIQAIQDAAWKKSVQLEKQLRESREKLWEAESKTPYDEGAVRKLASAREKTLTELYLTRTTARNQILSVLTAEQKATAERMGFYGKYPGPGRGYGPGPGYGPGCGYGPGWGQGPGWGYGPGRPGCPWWR